MTSIPALAERLSEAQRKTLASAKPTMDARVLVPAFVDRKRWPNGLIDTYSVAFRRLTPLGLQVREYLRSAEAERAAIVRWLRREARVRTDRRVAKLHWIQATKLADAIERGAHLEGHSDAG